MNNHFTLEGKVALVTGALGLLGRNHCEALASAGATVIVTDLKEAACRDFAESLSRNHGVHTLSIELDVTRLQSVQYCQSVILSNFGKLDVLINNAGVNEKVEDSSAEFTQFEYFPLELWKKSLDVNITGTFLCCQILGKLMADQKTGSIINIASTYGVVAPDQSIYRKPDGSQSFYKSAAYPTAKGAVLAFTRFLAAYWGDYSVRVNALSPGGVKNGQESHFIDNYSRRTPLGRMALPEDYRGAIVFLASDASRYMTGANLIIDGGWTIL